MLGCRQHTIQTVHLCRFWESKLLPWNLGGRCWSSWVTSAVPLFTSKSHYMLIRPLDIVLQDLRHCLGFHYLYFSDWNLSLSLVFRLEISPWLLFLSILQTRWCWATLQEQPLFLMIQNCMLSTNSIWIFIYNFFILEFLFVFLYN